MRQLCGRQRAWQVFHAPSKKKRAFQCALSFSLLLIASSPCTRSAGQMATLEKAEALLEELRVASVEAAKSDLEEVTAFAAEQARACINP